MAPSSLELDIPTPKCANKDLGQRDINVIAPTPNLLLQKESVCGKGIQVFRGCEAGHFKITLDELDPGVRVGEQVVDEILAVEAVGGTDAVLVVEEGFLDRMDGFDGLGGGPASPGC